MVARLPVALGPRSSTQPNVGCRSSACCWASLRHCAYVAIPPPDVGIMSRLGLRLALVGLGAELFRVRHADPTHWTRPRLPGSAAADQRVDLNAAEPAALQGVSQHPGAPFRSRRSDRQLFAPMAGWCKAPQRSHLLRSGPQPRREWPLGRGFLLDERAREIRTVAYLFGQSRFLSGSVNWTAVPKIHSRGPE